MDQSKDTPLITKFDIRTQFYCLVCDDYIDIGKGYRSTLFGWCCIHHSDEEVEEMEQEKMKLQVWGDKDE